METPGASDEEFFDAFESTAQMKLSLVSLGNNEVLSQDALSPEYESKLTDSMSSSLYESTPNMYLSEYSTFNSLSHKESDSSRAPAFKPSLQIIVKKHHKDSYEFAYLEQIQEIVLDHISNNTVWVLKFSPDGRFLALTGENPEIRLYEVSKQRLHGSQLLFYEAPYNIMQGHTQPVADLSWARSSTYFLSAGSDCIVYLWSVGASAPVLEFKHPQILTCICFHPINANYFMTGCCDRVVRVWNIPNYSIECTSQASDFITAGSFSPNGDLIILGLSHGQCLIYEAALEEMKLTLLTQIHCKNSRGRKSTGRKVTGFDFLDEQQVLITTNDSRMRLYNLKDFNLKQKYKGFVNERFPLKSTFSHNLMHAISGSENGNVYI